MGKSKAISGIKRVSITLKKGDRVVTTGLGKTKNWGNKVGSVTKRRGDKVFVQWDSTSFPIEDEMDTMELKLIKNDGFTLGERLNSSS
jgi:hypothetical protein